MAAFFPFITIKSLSEAKEKPAPYLEEGILHFSCSGVKDMEILKICDESKTRR